MDDESILESLEKILSDLSIEVRYERGEFQGGLYRYKDKRQIVINKDLGMEQKIRIIANEIKANVELDNLYLLPALREVIDDASRVE